MIIWSKYYSGAFILKRKAAALLCCALCALTACGGRGAESDASAAEPSSAESSAGLTSAADSNAGIALPAAETETPTIEQTEAISETESAADSVTAPPVTAPPETKPPETKPPETKPPETKPPETKPPETKPPETKLPETKPPETKLPETKPPETKPPETKPPETSAASSSKLDEAAIFASPAISGLKMPAAPGTYTKTSETAVIDYSNCSEGYVMVKFSGLSDKNYVVRVKAPSGTYYDYMALTPSDAYRTFPLSEGSGSYTVTLYESRGGTKYAAQLSAEFDAATKDDYTAFLYPNYYINYTGAYKAVKLAAHITGGIPGELEKISTIYNYVVGNFNYDYELAARLRGAATAYVPDLEAFMVSKKGICFDYASLMSAMLRSLGIPSKLIIGYADTAYHAWINVYTAETGWINAIISFDGKNWKLMDPTFASTSNENPEIMKYIGDGKNYTAKYTY